MREREREREDTHWYCAFLLQAFNVLSAIIEQRSQPGVTLECKVVEVRDVDVSFIKSLCIDDHSCWIRYAQILLAKKLDQGPAFILSFQAQQLTRKKREGSVDDVSCPRESWGKKVASNEALPFTNYTLSKLHTK